MPSKPRKKTLDAYIETTPVEVDVEPLPSSPTPSAAPAPPVKKTRARKKEEKTADHIIVQLPITADKIQTIIESSHAFEKPVANTCEPLPYSSTDYFQQLQDTVVCSGNGNGVGEEGPVGAALPTRRACFWCCHDIGAHKYGMPIAYDPVHQVFSQFGTFCSLECAAAHNFATHQGSDKVWEIHSWIQLLAKRLGIETPIRAAPSRYYLQLFGGPMTIEDFRACHKSLHRAYVMNIPPMINVNSQTEVMNISYIYDRQSELPEEQRSKLSRKKALMDSKRTLDAKMNLSYETVAVGAA